MAAKTNKKSSKKQKQLAKIEEKTSFSISDTKNFFLDVKKEFFRIAWPEKKMTLGLAGIVIVFAGVMSIYLGSVDFALGKLVSYVLG
ncbi:MAG: preprotein translocase subunit SecE [Desulfotalea sp.]